MRVVQSKLEYFVNRFQQMVIYPDHVGFPVGENGMTNYYMLEVHYNNPESFSDIKFETGLEIFYTPKLR